MPNIKTVTFPNLGWSNAADIHFPPNFSESTKYPTVITAHPIGSCKEQTSGNVYGAALPAAGYVVLAFDASFQGASGCEPRYIEDPGLRVGDFRFAIDYLVTLPYVDAQRIGLLGICGGGGYAIHATMTDHRLKACVSITGVNYGRVAQARGGERKILDYLPPSVEAANAAGITDCDVLEATHYYRTPRGLAENGPSKALYSFNSAACGWDAFCSAEKLLTQPFMAVFGERPGAFGAYRDGNEIYAHAGSEVKEMVSLPGVSHYDLYDKAAPQALEKVIPFLDKNLKGSK